MNRFFNLLNRFVSLLLPCSLFMASAAIAQNGPMHVILPLGPGSGVDNFARTVQPALSKALNGQVVVIENMPGAGGLTGTAALVKAEPNGNTIAFVSNNHAINPSVFKNMPFDSLKDITPISVIGSSPFVLVVNPNKVPVKTAKELQAFLATNPDQYNYASSGNGTIIQLAGEMFIQAAGVKLRHIPYKGMGPMLTDLMAGQVEMGVAAVAAVEGQLKSGALRAIGVMGRERVSTLPDVPTMIEQGFPTVDVQGWFAVIGPAKLPAEQVARIHAAVVQAFNDPTVNEKLTEQGNVINPTTPAVATQFFKSEQERYARLIAQSGIAVD
jgi:tripartite-type tricarboxylate transporter receptor subunit TctC